MRISQRNVRLGVISPWSLALAAAILISLHASAPQVPSNTWAGTGSMSAARSGASAVLLPNGYLLITGGGTAAGPTATAERYSVDGDSFVPTPSMHAARTHHASVLLPDGRVLVAGGLTGSGEPTASIEIYDPETNHWTEVAPLNEARANFAAVQTGGRVAFFGGAGADGPIASVEVFDPVLGDCRTVGVLSSPRQNHAAATLADGRVLIAGGSDGTRSLASADIYEPATHTIVAAPDMSTPREEFTATALVDGSVLMAGGRNGPYDQTSAELFDASSATFIVLDSSLGEARHAHVAIALPFNNSVLIAGGSSNAGPLTSAEIFTPWDRAFQPAAPMAHARSAAIAGAVGADGLVLVAGGDEAGTAELFGFATIKTDKADYAPAEHVAITGSGWQPGETVTLTFVEAPYHDTHPVRTATADSDGRIVDSEFAPDEHDIDIRFFLTARGSSQAGTVFTDGVAGVPANVDMRAPLRVLLARPPSFTVVGGTFDYDGNPHPATATATGSDGMVVPGTTSFTYSPGGDTPPTNAAVYAVTARFVSASPDYSDATGGAMITINKIAPTVKIDTRLYTYDARPHPATAVAVGIGGAAVAGSFRFSYTPSGTPLNVGAYRVTADFTSSDTNYLDAAATVRPSTRGGTWTTLAPMSSERYALATGVIDGKIYVSTANVEVYDPVANTWTVKAPAPPFEGGEIYGAGAGAIGTQLFVAGGHGASGNTSTVHVYDSIADSWSEGTSMPAANGLMASAVIDRKLFVAGGRDAADSFSVDTLWACDPAVGPGGSWTARKSLPMSRDSSAAAVFNGKLYLVGGNRDAAGEPQAYLNNVDVYDPAADVWTPLAPLRTARLGASAEFIDGILYAFGGYGEAGFLTTIEAYDPRSNTWETVGSMPLGRRYAASEVVNGTAFLFGGQVGRWFATTSADSFVPDGALRITAATLTVTADDKVKPFGAPLPALTASYSGFAGGESIADITGTPAIFTDATSASAVGTYPIDISRNTLSASNYVFKLVPGTLTVAPAPAFVTANNRTKTYGEVVNFNGTEFTTRGFMNGDGVASVTLTSAGAPAAAGANTYDIVPGGAAGTGLRNYDIHYENGRLTVGQAAARISISSYEGVYDGAPHGLAGTATGANGEDLTSLLNFGAAFTNVPGGSAHWTFAGDANHLSDTGDRRIVINQAAASINVTPFSGVYDGNGHGLGGSATGVKGESLDALLNLGATFTNVPGGTASWIFAGDANYRSASGDASVLIAARNIGVAADAQSKIYGSADPPLTYHATGALVGGDMFTGSLSRMPGENAGPYVITQGTLALSSNYAIAFAPGTLTIGKATITVTADDKTKAFGAEIPALTATYSGFVNSENLATSGIAGAPALSTTATATSVPGVYPIHADPGTLTALNYQFAFAPGTLTIQPVQAVLYTIRRLYDWTKVHQSGSTIPIKIQVLDASGSNASSWRLPVHVAGIAMISANTTGALSSDVDASADTDFRVVGFPTAYMLNLKTTGLARGTYNLLFTVGTDPTVYSTPFQIR